MALDGYRNDTGLFYVFEGASNNHQLKLTSISALPSAHCSAIAYYFPVFAPKTCGKIFRMAQKIVCGKSYDTFDLKISAIFLGTFLKQAEIFNTDRTVLKRGERMGDCW
ncbi:MAG: hypothetical protein QX191_01910 [Methylococcaceae bacterium]